VEANIKNPAAQTKTILVFFILYSSSKYPHSQKKVPSETPSFPHLGHFFL
jgi:hypothetical protein